MADRRRNRPANRPRSDAAPITGDIAVDDDTARALALFNQRLSAQAEAERAQKRIDRAARAKDDAAARVRALESDTKATVEQRNEAAAAYRAAVEAWERAKKGEPEPPKAPAPDAATADAGDDTPASDDTDALQPRDDATEGTAPSDH